MLSRVGGYWVGVRVWDVGGRIVRLQDYAICKTKQSKYPRRATNRILVLAFSPR